MAIVRSIRRIRSTVVVHTSRRKPAGHWATSCSIGSPRSKASQSSRSSRARSMKFQRCNQAARAASGGDAPPCPGGWSGNGEGGSGWGLGIALVEGGLRGC